MSGDSLVILDHLASLVPQERQEVLVNREVLVVWVRLARLVAQAPQANLDHLVAPELTVVLETLENLANEVIVV